MNFLKKENVLKDIGNLNLDYSRDCNLTDFSKAILNDRYLYTNEDFQLLFARVASHYADDEAHAQRLYDYISKLWFMPSTPILSNGGTDRGLPISCFLNETTDSLKGIVDMWTENVWLASRGGGIGSYWGNLRSIGESVKDRGKTSGIIPFVVVQNALTLAISQGSLRRGSSAVYLPVSHPEIEEFLDIRKPIGGDPNRKALNLHHGIVISDNFMLAVQKNMNWNLISPKDGKVINTIRARDIWIKILNLRVETGEPYLIFIDSVNRNKPDIYKKLGLDIKMSNLCSEITLATGKDHLNNIRTAVCCLSSLNMETYDEWKDNENLIEDILRFLDNVLSDFIENAPVEMKNAVYAAKRERSIGLGVMGFHSYLQKNMIPFSSPQAKDFNLNFFSKLRKKVDSISHKLALERGACHDGQELGINERFINKLAIAPTASISIIAGNTSPGIDPCTASIYTHRTLTGSFTVRNKFLVQLLESKGKNTDDVWHEILSNDGSVQTLSCLTNHEKEVFKTASEIDQRWLIEHCSDRIPFVCQSQSLNLFVPPNISKKELHNLHILAWKKGIKSMYYQRTKSLQRTDKIDKKSASFAKEINNFISEQPEGNYNKIIENSTQLFDSRKTNNKYDDTDCLSCQ